MNSTTPLLLLAAALALAGCQSPEEKALTEHETAVRDFTEKRRANAKASGDAMSERGAEVLAPDMLKTFNPGSAQLGNRAAHTGTARTGEFRFTERFRTRDFATRDYATKNAWGGDFLFKTKDARTKDAREAGKTARTKEYATETASEASRIAAVRPLPGGDRPFLGPESERMKRGIQPQDQAKFEQSWGGDLTPMTIEDVKKLLNKN